MALTITHSKVSTLPDVGSSDLVHPSDWNADHVITGTLSTADLGSGTANSTTFLRGDSTWATPTVSVTWGSITGTLASQTDLATALSGKSDTSHTHVFSSLTGIPTTVAGYGITDVYTKTAADTLLSGKSDTSHTHTFASLTSKPTTLSGYGITDAQPLDSDLTTIAGLTATTDSFLQSKSSAWTTRTVAQVKTDLGLTGTNSGDQTITLTGDVTGSGTGSFAATIGSGTVTLAKMANLAANSIIGNNTGASGVPIALTTAQVKTLLAIASGDVSGLGSLATASSVNLSTQATGTLQAGQVPAFTGDVTTVAGALGTTIAANAVTNAKLATVATQIIKGRNTASSGNVEDITLTQALDWLSSTQGAILYRDAASWAALAPGTSTQFLKSGGAGANPSWSTPAGSGDLVGPASSVDTSIPTFSGTTGKLLQDPAGPKIGSNGQLKPKAGTTAVAPIVLTSGTNLTTAAAGSVEYDGGVQYFTPVGTSRGVLLSPQLVQLAANYTLTSTTSLQKIFNSTANGAVQVETGMNYIFELYMLLSSLSATSGDFKLGFGGTATIGSIQYTALAAKAAATTPSTAQGVTSSVATAQSLVTANTTTAGWAKVNGILRVTTGGTFIPQVGLGVAAAAIVNANSRFLISPISASTTVGNWT